jgi:hypothetical protein
MNAGAPGTAAQARMNEDWARFLRRNFKFFLVAVPRVFPYSNLATLSKAAQ